MMSLDCFNFLSREEPLFIRESGVGGLLLALGFGPVPARNGTGYRPHKLEILESSGPLMVFMHGLAPAKVVFNTKCGSEEQSDCRSAA